MSSITLQSLLHSALISSDPPTYLNPLQLSSFLTLCSNHLLLFNQSNIPSISSKKSQTSMYIPTLLEQITSGLNNTRDQILQYDIPTYSKILSDTNPLSQLQSSRHSLSPTLMKIVQTKLKYSDSIEQIEMFLRYVKIRLENMTMEEELISIEEVEEWRYQEEYSRKVEGVRDVMDVVRLIKMGEFEREILIDKLESLSMVLTHNISHIANNGNSFYNQPYFQSTISDRTKEEQQFPTLPTQSSVQQSLDCYYFSQIQKLQQQLHSLTLQKLNLFDSIKQNQYQQENNVKRLNELEEQNQQIKKEIQQLKGKNREIQKEIEIRQLNWKRERKEYENRIINLEYQNKISSETVKNLSQVIRELKERISQKIKENIEHSSFNQQGLSEKKVQESFYGYYKKASSIKQMVSLANQIRQTLGQGDKEESREKLRKWSDTLEKFDFQKENEMDQKYEEQKIEEKVLEFHSIQHQTRSQSREVFKVQYLTSLSIIPGYLNVSSSTLIFQDHHHISLKLIPLSYIQQISLHGNLLILRISSLDYLISTLQPFKITNLIPLSVNLLDSLSHLAFSTQSGLIPLSSFPVSILNPNKISFEGIRWMGKVRVVKKGLWGKKEEEGYGVLKGEGLVVWEGRGMMRVKEYVGVGGVNAKVEGDVVRIGVDGWGEKYVIRVEEGEAKILAKEIEEIKNHIRENIESKYKMNH